MDTQKEIQTQTETPQQEIARLKSELVRANKEIERLNMTCGDMW